ncbi:dihydrofolate reductase family protein [Candidatus Roizmanbacteria bacterium]|nr:dihydrofolate reductase family protein [Candidatus Roizmanbacteria bacterium]
MKVVLLMVSSVNGKITQGNDPHIYSWTSEEDKQIFSTQIEKSNLIVMGSNTYTAAKSMMKHTPGRRRIIMTRSPEKYASEEKPGMLEFTSESPKHLINRMKKNGYAQMLLVGGSIINSLFLEDNLIDEIHLTIEPCIFGKGKNLISESDIVKKLTLVSITPLNTRGTLHAVYTVEN